jgi:hypothetical protein
MITCKGRRERVVGPFGTAGSQCSTVEGTRDVSGGKGMASNFCSAITEGTW